jgi:hypothetical protein
VRRPNFRGGESNHQPWLRRNNGDPEAVGRVTLGIALARGGQRHMYAGETGTDD